MIFYISSARFNATNANTTRIFVRKYDDEGTYEELLNTSYMGFEASKGYKFNFTTTGFSIFIPAYIAAAEEEDEGGNEEGGNNGGSSGGGSFGYWTATYIVNSSLLESENGYTRLLTVKQRLKLNISGQSHYVGVVKLEANSAVINVSSRMQQATLQVGESRMFDITEDGASDIEVTLKSVANGSAEIGISLVKEDVFEEQETSEPETGGADQTGKPADGQEGAACTPNWMCSEWSKCKSGLITRTCSDTNSCGTESGRPEESRQCVAIWPVLLWLGLGIVAIVFVTIVFLRKKQAA